MAKRKAAPEPERTMTDIFHEGEQFQREWHALWQATPEDERDQLLSDMNAWREAVEG